MQCPNCKQLRHEGECKEPTCEACGWPLSEGQERLCDECSLEVSEIYSGKGWDFEQEYRP